MVPVVYPLPPCDHVAFAYAVYDDDDEPAAVVNVAGGKVIEEFESIGMVYDAVVPQNEIALFKENPAIEFVESDAQVKIAQDTSIEYSEP